MNGTEIMPVTQPGASALIRAEVDTQVTTAKAYPRQIDRVMARAIAMATQTEEMAGRCLYAVSRGGKTLEGPSVRLAEILASCWGNLRAETKITDEGERSVTAKATVWDMETNVLISQEVRRRITTRDGKRYNDDMISTTMNAASSIALRNAMFRVVPRGVVDEVYDRAVEVYKKSASALSTRVTRALETFGKLGVVEARVLARVEVGSVREVTHDHLATLAGLLNAIRDGEQDIDEAFPLPVDPAQAPQAAPVNGNGKPQSKMDEAAARLAEKANPAPAPAAAQDPDPLDTSAPPVEAPKAEPKSNGKRIKTTDKTVRLTGEEATGLLHALETSNRLGDNQTAGDYIEQVLGLQVELENLTRQQAEIVLKSLRDA